MKRFLRAWRYWTVFAVTLALSLSFASCGRGRDPFAFRATPFLAEITGEVDGERVEARLYLDLTEHRTKEIYEVACIEYRAPESLSGLVVSLRSDGTLSARLRDMQVEGDFALLLEPYLSLLSIDKEYDSIVCGKGGNITISFTLDNSPLTYLFHEDGNSLHITGVWASRPIDLEITLSPR